jgi:AcrR family transcriptional regulator
MILDAAEQVLMDQGAWRFTLDAVSKQAGVSKGGVLYHFPSKDALLKGMVERLLERGGERRRENRAAMGDSPESVLRADVQACLMKEDHNPRLGAALIAALANAPELAKPIREFHDERFRELSDLPLDRDAATILYLAADGLMLMEMLNASPFDEDQRAALVETFFSFARRISAPPVDQT